MVANVYTERSDLYNYGLPRGSLGLQGRLADSATAASDNVVLDGHGFSTNDPVLFSTVAGGNLPAPLAASVTYYAIYVDDATFQVAATVDGSAINLTTDAVTLKVASPLPFDDVMEFYSRWVDSFCPEHLVPFTAPIPALVKGIVAQLSATKLSQLAGHKADSLDAAELKCVAQMERWVKGISLRGDPTATKLAGLAPTKTLVVGGFDPRGWGPGGILP